MGYILAYIYGAAQLAGNLVQAIWNLFTDLWNTSEQVWDE